MATPEAAFKKVIQRAMKEVLDARGLKHKIHWNAGQLAGLPRLDCDGVIAGHPFAIEVKRPDGKGKGLTGRQKFDLNEYREAGAFSMLVDDQASLDTFLIWISQLKPRSSHTIPAE